MSEDNTCARVTSGQRAPAGGRATTSTTVPVRGEAQCSLLWLTWTPQVPPLTLPSQQKSLSDSYWPEGAEAP